MTMTTETSTTTLMLTVKELKSLTFDEKNVPPSSSSSSSSSSCDEMQSPSSKPLHDHETPDLILDLCTSITKTCTNSLSSSLHDKEQQEQKLKQIMKKQQQAQTQIQAEMCCNCCTQTDPTLLVNNKYTFHPEENNGDEHQINPLFWRRYKRNSPPNPNHSSKQKTNYIPITKCQLRQHNNIQTGIWILCGTSIYDATDFIHSHPGGVKSILRKSGGIVDCTRDMKFHSQSAVKLWKSMKIGYLVPCSSNSNNESSSGSDRNCGSFAGAKNKGGSKSINYDHGHEYNDQSCVIC